MENISIEFNGKKYNLEYELNDGTYKVILNDYLSEFLPNPFICSDDYTGGIRANYEGNSDLATAIRIELLKKKDIF